MIYRENKINVETVTLEHALEVDSKKDIFKEAVFFDLEHYVYKKPICVGVFGCSTYEDESINVTQYMIENKKDSREILDIAKKYFEEQINERNKKYLVTFSGNNDYVVINYLFKKYKINFDLKEHFKHIDLQRYYENYMKSGIGLKNLEKIFNINRESELISGSNLAKTFSRIVKDNEYIDRMNKKKIENILLYNEQDIVSLFHIYLNWNKYIKKTDME